MSFFQNLRKEFFFLSILFNCSLILFPRLYKYLPILALISYAIGNPLIKNKKITLDLKLFSLLAIPYLILLVGVFHTQNIEYGIRKLEIGAVLLIYPFIFSLISKEQLKKLYDKKKHFIHLVFGLSIIVFSAIIFFYFLAIKDLLFVTHHYITFINESIPPRYQIHSIYLALMAGLGIILLVDSIVDAKKPFIRYASIAFALYLIALLILLNKRMAIISLPIVLILYFYVKYKVSLLTIKFMLGTIGLIALLFLGNRLTPRFQNVNNFNEFKQISKTIKDPNTSIGKRVFIYKTSFDLIQRKPLFGYGTGDANFELSKAMQSEAKFNTHNQFLSYLLSNGFLIGGFFFIYLIILFVTTIKNQDFLFLAVLSYFTLNFLSENILEREAGVLLYSFFISFFARKIL